MQSLTKDTSFPDLEKYRLESMVNSTDAQYHNIAFSLKRYGKIENSVLYIAFDKTTIINTLFLETLERFMKEEQLTSIQLKNYKFSKEAKDRFEKIYPSFNSSSQQLTIFKELLYGQNFFRFSKEPLEAASVKYCKDLTEKEKLLEGYSIMQEEETKLLSKAAATSLIPPIATIAAQPKDGPTEAEKKFGDECLSEIEAAGKLKRQPTQAMLDNVRKAHPVYQESLFEQLILISNNILTCEGLGDCLFHAFAKRLSTNADAHARDYVITNFLLKHQKEMPNSIKNFYRKDYPLLLREIAIQNIKEKWNYYSHFISENENPNTYCARMMNPREGWGGQTEIISLVEVFKNLGKPFNVQILSFRVPPKIIDGVFIPPEGFDLKDDEKGPTFMLHHKNSNHYQLIVSNELAQKIALYEINLEQKTEAKKAKRKLMEIDSQEVNYSFLDGESLPMTTNPFDPTAPELSSFARVTFW